MEQYLQVGGHELPLDRTLIMGVLNVTPDSFSDGGEFNETQKAVKRALQMIKEGADIIDIGGESSRPGAALVTYEEEVRRVLPVIKELSKKTTVPLSIDTIKPEVADLCLSFGASMINDISGLGNEEMIAVAAKHKVPVVLMHMQGTPQTMQDNPQYKDIIKEIKDFFMQRVQIAKNGGVSQIILDPGIGFGKSTEHNLEIIAHLGELNKMGYPILIGPSRKSFIGAITGLPVEERLEGTLAAISISIMNGAHIVRVHDVLEAKRAAMIADAIRDS